MNNVATTHFVSFAQAVLCRGASLEIVWSDLAALAAITIVLFGISLMRFMATIMAFQ